MPTKAEERKALAQIRAIVDALGEDSYIGIALEGCLDDAEMNIENDIQRLEQKIAELEGILARAKSALGSVN